VVFDADPLLVFSLVTAIPRTLIHDAVTGLIHLFTSQSGSAGSWPGLAATSPATPANPRAVNLSDINAQNGTPSVGLMQVIGPTFAANAGPFRNTGPFLFGTSINPLANIYAALHYAIGRYGAGWTSVLGHGHG
jgi:SLT domain-containing protein